MNDWGRLPWVTDRSDPSVCVPHGSSRAPAAPLATGAISPAVSRGEPWLGRNSGCVSPAAPWLRATSDSCCVAASTQMKVDRLWIRTFQVGEGRASCCFRRRHECLIYYVSFPDKSLCVSIVVSSADHLCFNCWDKMGIAEENCCWHSRRWKENAAIRRMQFICYTEGN